MKYREAVAAAIAEWKKSWGISSAASDAAVIALDWMFMVEEPDKALKSAVDWLLRKPQAVQFADHNGKKLAQLNVGGSLYTKLTDHIKKAEPANLAPSASSQPSSASHHSAVVHSMAPSSSALHPSALSSAPAPSSSASPHSAVVYSNQHNNYSNQHNNYSNQHNNNNVTSMALRYSAATSTASSLSSAVVPSPSALPPAPKPKGPDVVANALKHAQLWSQVVVTDIPTETAGVYELLPENKFSDAVYGAALVEAVKGKATDGAAAKSKKEFWMTYGAKLWKVPPKHPGVRYSRCMGCAALAAYTLVMDQQFNECAITTAGNKGYDHYFVILTTPDKRDFAVDIWQANLPKSKSKGQYVYPWDSFPYNKGKPEFYVSFSPETRAQDQQSAQQKG